MMRTAPATGRSHLDTPWGRATTRRRIASGIYSLTTAGHGGLHVARPLLAEMPEPLRRHEPWAGEGWYEEDCDWAIVVLAWPQHFPVVAVRDAVRLVEAWKPELLHALRRDEPKHWAHLQAIVSGPIRGQADG